MCEKRGRGSKTKWGLGLDATFSISQFAQIICRPAEAAEAPLSFTGSL